MTPVQQPSSRGTLPNQPVRVVLVGQTGLDTQLRHDPAVELARVRSPLDAIGELAEMSEPNDDRPAAVVFGPGTFFTEQAETMAEALRKIDAQVRVFAVGDVDGAASAFDGLLPARADAAALRRLLNPEPTPHATSVVVVAQTPSAVAPRPAAAPSTPTPGTQQIPAPASDGSLVPLAAMLVGKDPITAAVDDLSARLGTPCKFAPGDAAAPADAASCVRVTHNGRTLGWLRAPSVERYIVEAEAAKLAHWVLLAAQHDQLRRAAFTDELTGAFNRRYFNRFLAAALDQAREKRHTVTLLVFDIDNFKTYNDRYSHSAGDEILVESVRLLTSVIRPTDRVCRVGGDEFAVIFHDPEGPRNPGAAQSPQSIAQIAQRFQKQICEHRFPKLANEAPGTLTISGGLATFPWDGATPEELLARADELAMQSKRQGKNAITFGPGAMRACQLAE